MRLSHELLSKSAGSLLSTFVQNREALQLLDDVLRDAPEVRPGPVCDVNSNTTVLPKIRKKMWTVEKARQVLLTSAEMAVEHLFSSSLSGSSIPTECHWPAAPCHHLAAGWTNSPTPRDRPSLSGKNPWCAELSLFVTPVQLDTLCRPCGRTNPP